MSYPEQPSYIRVGSAWKTIEQAFVYKDGAWKRINQAYIYRAGAWKRFYAYDSISPTIVRFNLTDTVNGQTYGVSKTTASYVLEFSEPILYWDASMVSFSSNPGNSWEISSVTNPTSDNKTYVVSINMSGTQTSGTVQLSVDPTGIKDESDINPWVGSAVLSQSFTIDVTSPSVPEFASYSAATAVTVDFTLRFSEPVTGLSISNFTIGGTSTGWSLHSLSGAGNLYTIRLIETSLGSTTNGTLTLSLDANCVSDALANVGPVSAVISSEFTVARSPVTPSISAISSSDLTLHDRQVNFTVSVPSGSTTITHVIGYLYNSSDVYTGTSVTIDVTDTTSSFTTNGSFNVGRNPSTKYYVRAKTLNTFGLLSEFSSRAEITTGVDRKPPVLAAPSVSSNTPTDPGYPGASVTRSLSFAFYYPSSYLTNEVGSVTVYLIRSSDGATISSTSFNKGSGWTSTALTGTFSGLPASTSYYIFARSVDIYGGTNSTNDSGATTTSTTAVQSNTHYYYEYFWSPETDPGSGSTGTFNVDENTYVRLSNYALPGVSNIPNDTRYSSDQGITLGDTAYRVTQVNVEAYTGSSGTTICTTSRYFIVKFSGTSTTGGSSGGTYNALQAPFSTNSGTTPRNENTGWSLGYGNAGAARITVEGRGTIPVWSTSPDQRIYVKVRLSLRARTWSRQLLSTVYTW